MRAPRASHEGDRDRARVRARARPARGSRRSARGGTRWRRRTNRAPGAAADARRSLDFEQALERLETIVEELEDGELALEDSLARFEEGVRLTRFPRAARPRAEARRGARRGSGRRGPRRAEDERDEPGGGDDARSSRAAAAAALRRGSRATRRAAFARHWLASTALPPRLADALRHAALAPGKRLRPLLVLSAASRGGAAADALARGGGASRWVHAYSLVHDDLPAMDDDDLRRGRPTCHKKFGEATAILAGDALLALAFEELGDRGESCRRAPRGALAVHEPGAPRRRRG